MDKLNYRNWDGTIYAIIFFKTPLMSNAAIYYNPEAYTTDKPQLMGRNAAGESF